MNYKRIDWIFIALGVAVTLLIIAGMILTQPQAQAKAKRVCFCHDLDHNPHTICTDKEGEINGHNGHVEDGRDSLGSCETPTVTATPIPEETPPPDPEETPAPTPETVPGNGYGLPGDGLSDGRGGTPYTPAVCNGVVLKPAILTTGERVSATEVRFSWFPSTDSHDKQAIVYGYQKDQLVYGIPVLDHSSNTIVLGQLRPNTPVWASIWTFRDACMSPSDVIDP